MEPGSDAQAPLALMGVKLIRMVGEVDRRPILIFLCKGSCVKPPSGEVSIVGSLITLTLT